MVTLDSAIVAEYKSFNVPADQIVADPALAEQFAGIVNRRLPPNQRVDVPTVNKRVLNLRRRGEENGGLPRIRNGHGPTKTKPR